MNFVKRIIPCLDFYNGRIVKGVKFNNLIDIGNPLDVCKYYVDEGADELIILDISANIEKKLFINNFVNSISSFINIPLTVGGGINSLFDVKKLLNSGADKVSLNTCVINNINIIKDILFNYGSQCIINSLDVKNLFKKNFFYYWNVYKNSGKINLKINLLDLILKFLNLGVGELLITSIDLDGTNLGFNVNLINKISKLVKIPIICSGGFGNLISLSKLLKIKNIDAILIASSLHKKKYRIINLKNFLFNNGFLVNF